MRTLTSQQLTQAALDSRDFSEVVEAAARFLGNPLVIIAAATGSIVGHSRGLTPPDDTWLAAVDRGYITLEFVATLANWDHYKDRDPSRRYECITVTAINGRPRRFYKLTVRGQLLGYLNITRLDESFDTLPEEDCFLAAALPATDPHPQYKALHTCAAAGKKNRPGKPPGLTPAAAPGRPSTGTAWGQGQNSSTPSSFPAAWPGGCSWPPR